MTMSQIPWYSLAHEKTENSGIFNGISYKSIVTIECLLFQRVDVRPGADEEEVPEPTAAARAPAQHGPAHQWTVQEDGHSVISQCLFVN